MNLLSHAAERGRSTLIWTAVLGVASGLASTALLTLTARALAAPAPRLADMFGFAALAIAAAAIRYVSATVSLRFTNLEQTDMAFDLCRVVVQAPLRRVEELGGDRLMATLNDDLNVISRSIVELPGLVTNVVIVVGCFTYLAVFSRSIFLIVLAGFVFALVPYMLIAKKAYARMMESRRERDELMGHYRALTDGITELKLHRPRRTAFLADALRTVLHAIARFNIEGQSLYNLANGYRQAVFALTAAPIIFGGAYFGYDRGIATGAVLTLFYLFGPLDGVMNAFPMMARANVALRSYERVLASLPAEDHGGAADARPIVRAAQIELSGIRYAYPGPEGFSIGPIDLSIQAGEILFIAGGNGSGKTTLAKIIAGLYEPTGGTLSVDGEPITARNRDHYRQLVTCVFAKFHLFRQLLGVDTRFLADRLRIWLRRLQLDRSLHVENGAFSTLDLSTGQRKRMALLVAMIDDRPICVFDEWAAEQDPVWRQEFYLNVLPELKARGKAIVVITHDDRYFGVGDRLVRMEQGRIESHVISTAQPAALWGRT